MRISDWSSTCALPIYRHVRVLGRNGWGERSGGGPVRLRLCPRGRGAGSCRGLPRIAGGRRAPAEGQRPAGGAAAQPREIGSEPWRGRVCTYVLVCVVGGTVNN